MAQSGGPTAVINASVAGLITESLNNDCIEEVYGSLNGILGILQEDLVDLAAESQQQIRALKHTPGAALGSCRYKLKKQADLDRILEIEPAFLEADEHDHDHHDHGHGHHHDHGHHHHHDHGSNLKVYHDEEMQSVSVLVPGDLDPDKFMPWINDLVQKEGPNILRSKGILSFKNDPKRFVFQGVHMILDGDSQREWKPGETRESKVVFIGRNLKEDELRQGVLSCKV